jgi:hypothetical protein
MFCNPGGTGFIFSNFFIENITGYRFYYFPCVWKVYLLINPVLHLKCYSYDFCVGARPPYYNPIGYIIDNDQNAAFLANFNIDQHIKYNPNHLNYSLKLSSFSIGKEN